MLPDRLAESVHTLSDDDLLALVSDEVTRRPTLRLVRDDVTALLAMAPALARAQDRAVENVAGAAAARSRIIASAMASILDGHEMLDSTAVSRILGRSPTSRNTASRLAASGDVIALPVGAKKLFPAFQFDARDRRVRSIVAEINRRLDARNDPWGVASWWLSPTAFGDDPRLPAELAADPGGHQTLRDLVEDMTSAE